MQFLIWCSTLIAVVVSIPDSPYNSQNPSSEDTTFLLYEDENGLHREDLLNVEVDLQVSEANVTYHFFSQKNPVIGLHILSNDENGTIHPEDLANVKVDLEVSEANVTYYFFSQKNPAIGLHILPNDTSILNNSAFDSAKDTLFIVHGWKNSHDSPINSHIKGNVLKTYDVNVFVVDWSSFAEDIYLAARLSVGWVGEFIAAFIRSLNTQYSLQLDNVTIVGHSLGAHVSGSAGAALNGQVKLIVGLDPAGPFFLFPNSTNRLDPTDAKFVQVIHTNDGLLGLDDEIGHVDYYPNGGSIQPGCESAKSGSCSHSRAYMYYAESLNTKEFISRKCSGWDEYVAGKCAKGSVSSMGMFNVDTRARGRYYLATRSSSPFADGE